MICPFCGADIPDGSKECFVCGEIIMRKEPSSSLGQGITIIPNSSKDEAQGSGSSNGYISSYDYNGTQSYSDPYTPAAKSKSKLPVIFAAIALAVLALVLCISFGVFANRDGKYTVQNLDEVFRKIMEANGEQTDLTGVGMETYITIDGKDCVFYTKVTYEGTVVSETEYHGTVSFSGNKINFKWDDRTGMGMAKYDKSKKSITFDLDREDADFYGMENLVFVKVDE